MIRRIAILDLNFVFTVLCLANSKISSVAQANGQTEGKHDGQTEGAFYSEGTFKFIDLNNQNSRVKRSIVHLEKVLEIKTTKWIPHPTSGSSSLRLRLKRSADMIGENYKLVIRDGDQVTSVNETVPRLNCLFDGYVEEFGTKSKAAISTCHQNGLRGLISLGDKSLAIEETTRRKRFSQNTDVDGHIVVFESKISASECGLKPNNMEKMMKPKRESISLEELKRSDDVNAEFDVARNKRSDSEKAIELAVFVDDEMFAKEETFSPENPVESVENLVFTYLHAVQLLYRSDRLDTHIRIVLVHLEIFKSRIRSLNKADGEIETYLDSFCDWQKQENPSSDPWDHGLLLTGLDLFDKKPKFDSVIGLAWVSGMCHPSYSCTINEGSNFESVYVIAHEMGHNLGMNHDGERKEGNHCDADKYLMSPILGAGKVTWSSCSNREVEEFINGRKTSIQAQCLNNLPAQSKRYNFIRRLPGEESKAIEQCHRAFGKAFFPHVIPGEEPFDDLCRELWCKNSTHALRAHPALEATDCSSKPYPYGSVCKSGRCLPYDPNESNEVDIDRPMKPVDEAPDIGLNENTVVDNDEDRPVWFDPIFTKVFKELRKKFREKYNVATEAAQSVKLEHKFSRKSDEFIEYRMSPVISKDTGWRMIKPKCPVDCGGGWIDVQFECQKDSTIPTVNCLMEQKPNISRTVCNIDPCE